MAVTIEEIKQAVIAVEEDLAEKLVTDALDEGLIPNDILSGVLDGIRIIGDKFESGEYFLLELTLGGNLGGKLVDMIRPHLPVEQQGRNATIVLASVKGDLHDIGKNLVSLQLSLAGYRVIDMGIDVDSMAIIRKAQDEEADFIALSAVMITTMSVQGDFIRDIKELGLRDKFKIIIGGGPTTKEWAEQIGADGWALDAVGAVKLVESMSN